jgi:hypothetical protein
VHDCSIPCLHWFCIRSLLISAGWQVGGSSQDSQGTEGSSSCCSCKCHVSRHTCYTGEAQQAADSTCNSCAGCKPGVIGAAGVPLQLLAALVQRDGLPGVCVFVFSFSVRVSVRAPLSEPNSATLLVSMQSRFLAATASQQGCNQSGTVKGARSLMIRYDVASWHA